MNDFSAITLAVLAGGEGRRMGRAKGEIQLEGKPILEYLLSQWRWPGPTMLVTAPGREHPTGASLFDHEVVDPVAGAGPLRGTLTALENCATDSLIVATVDMPGVENAQLTWLAERLPEHPASCGVFLEICSGGHPRRIEPFPAALRCPAREIVAQQLANGDASVQSLARRSEFTVLRAPSEWAPRVWSNLNHPADIAKFEALPKA
jgi:molybdopterin-guanine dinucleotide biosynthesis protein A